jgi:hypothetical protein
MGCSNHTIPFKQSLYEAEASTPLSPLHRRCGSQRGRCGASIRSTPNVLTPDIVESVQQIVDAEGIPGLTLAIVNKTGLAELGAWGIKFENGTKMTTDVSHAIFELYKRVDG